MLFIYGKKSVRPQGVLLLYSILILVITFFCSCKSNHSELHLSINRVLVVTYWQPSINPNQSYLVKYELVQDGYDYRVNYSYERRIKHIDSLRKGNDTVEISDLNLNADFDNILLMTRDEMTNLGGIAKCRHPELGDKQLLIIEYVTKKNSIFLTLNSPDLFKINEKSPFLKKLLVSLSKKSRTDFIELYGGIPQLEFPPEYLRPN